MTGIHSSSAAWYLSSSLDTASLGFSPRACRLVEVPPVSTCPYEHLVF